MSFLSASLQSTKSYSSRGRQVLLQICALLPVVCGLSGCGGSKFQMAPVSGVCLCNGNPIEAGLVVFEPIPESGTSLQESGRSASGMLNPDGTFVLSTFGKNDGAIVGKHKVLVFAPPLEDDDAPLTDENRYACGNQPVEQEITPGENNIQLALTHTPSKARRR